MSNVLSEEEQKQIIALGQLGWSLRRIQKRTGIRRETAATYLKAAGIAIRFPGAWGKRAPAKPANGVTTDSEPEQPATPKPANEVTTDSRGAASVSEPYREAIEQGLRQGRNGIGCPTRAAGGGTFGWPRCEGRSSGRRAGFDGIFENASGFDGTRRSDGSVRCDGSGCGAEC